MRVIDEPKSVYRSKFGSAIFPDLVEAFHEVCDETANLSDADGDKTFEWV